MGPLRRAGGGMHGSGKHVNYLMFTCGTHSGTSHNHEMICHIYAIPRLKSAYHTPWKCVTPSAFYQPL